MMYIKAVWDFVTAPVIRGQLRHALSAVGAVFVARGYVDASMLDVGIGVIMAGLAMYDSYKTKKEV